MVPRAQSGRGGWRAAVTMAVTIALVVGIVGTVVLVLMGRTFGTAFSAVLPGILLGAGASLLLTLLGNRNRHRRLEDELERMDRDQPGN